jgi:hypothetical protein
MGGGGPPFSGAFNRPQVSLQVEFITDPIYLISGHYFSDVKALLREFSVCPQKFEVPEVLRYAFTIKYTFIPILRPHHLHFHESSIKHNCSGKQLRLDEPTNVKR